MKTLLPSSLDSAALRTGLADAGSSVSIRLLIAAVRSARVDSSLGIDPPQPLGGARY